MAQKLYKLSPEVLASPQFASQASYGFRTSFQQSAGGTDVRVLEAKDCPLITCAGSDVLGTTNVWAQKFMDVAKIPSVSFMVGGSSWLGTPGAAIFVPATGAVTIDLDAIFPAA